MLEPALQQAREAGQGLRTLYLIEDLDWKRSAIVSDLDWMARATRVFAWMIRGRRAVFGLAEPDQAKAWVAGGQRRACTTGSLGPSHTTFGSRVIYERYRRARDESDRHPRPSLSASPDRVARTPASEMRKQLAELRGRV